MDLIDRAITFATAAHAGQRRKYTDEPYITHPIRVSATLAELGFPQEVVASAVLHDTVEDTATTHAQIEAEFGARVSQLVRQVTDVSIGQAGNRAARKAMDRDHLAQADAEGQSIKLADVLDNTETIVAHDPSFTRTYMAEKADLLDVLVLGHPRLRERAIERLVEYRSTQRRQD